jgi:hypothetical protein
MKLILFLLFVSSLTSWARLDDMSHFSSALMEDVKRDVKNNNAEDLKKKSDVSRGPASVEVDQMDIQEFPEGKTEKFNQLGPKKW